MFRHIARLHISLIAAVLFLGSCVKLDSPAGTGVGVVPNQLGILIQPGPTTAGNVINPFVQVSILDAAGRLVNISGIPVTVSLGANPGNTQLQGTLTVNTVDGIATFADLAINIASQGYTLVFTTSSFSGSAVSDPFAIQAGSVTNFAIVNQPVNTIAGQPISSPGVQVAFVDQFGNIVTSQNGAVTVTLATVGQLFGTTVVSTVNGVATFSDLSLQIARDDNQLQFATPGFNPTLSNLFDITPAAASQFVMDVFPLTFALGGGDGPSNIEAGADNQGTVTVKDVFGNVVRDYTGTVHLSTTDQSATLPADFTYTLEDQGFKFFNDGFIFLVAGAQTLNAVDISNPLINGTESVLVSPTFASSYVLSGIPSTVSAGVFTTFTVTARDPYGNVATNYTGTVGFFSTDQAGQIPANYQFTLLDQGVHTFTNGLQFVTAGSQTLTATDQGTDFSTSASSNVTAGAAVSFEVSGIPNPVVAGVSSSLTVRARDSFGNTATSYLGTISVTSDDQQATLPGNYTFTIADNGIHVFNGLIFRTSGTHFVQAQDTITPSIFGNQPFNVNPAAASTFQVTGIPDPITAGVDATVTVIARDPFGNIATGFLGTVQFTSNDPQATLPPNFIFNFSDLGQHTFTNGVTLRSSGLRTVTVSSFPVPNITGAQTVQVNAAALDHFTLAFPPFEQMSIPFTGVADVTAKDQFDNTVLNFNAATNNVTMTSNPAGSITGLGTGNNNVLNRPVDFANGVAHLAGQMRFDGDNGVYSFTATSANGKVGTIANITLEGAPLVDQTKFIRYLDSNRNATCDVTDLIFAPFDEPVQATFPKTSAFRTVVSLDSLGTSGGVGGVNAANNREVFVPLANNPHLRTRGTFNPLVLTANSPSGVDVGPGIAPNEIESTHFFVDATLSDPIDVIPAFWDTNQNLGVTNTRAVALGDFDQDGDLDMIVGSAGTLADFRNAGNGNFVFNANLPNAGDVRSVALGDVNGDGRLDLVVGNGSGQPDQVYLYAAATGQFVNSGQALGTFNTTSIALGDMNKDGKLDIVAARANGQPSQVYPNPGNGVFSLPPVTYANKDAQKIVLADMDRDGDLDIIQANSSAQRVEYYRNASMVFSVQAQTLGPDNANALAVGDIDGDGDLDLVTGGAGGQPAFVFTYNSATNQFVFVEFQTAPDILDLALGDFDGDTDLDLLIANGSGQPDLVRFNNGNGTFFDTGQALGTASSTSVALGDLDKDGDVDFVQGNSDSGTRVFTGSLTGTWGTFNYVQSPITFGNNPIFASLTLDFDRDGKMDIITGKLSTQSPLSVLRGNGNGTFSAITAPPATGPITALATGDLNRDGYPDLIVGNYGQSQPLQIFFYNKTTGLFESSGQAFPGTFCRALAVGDLDRDGDLDFIEGVSEPGIPGVCIVWMNDGNGTFTNPAGFNFGLDLQIALALGDVDKDGDLDLIQGNDNDHNSVLFLNDGTGHFTASPSQFAPGPTNAVIFADVDSDGDLDIVTANGSAQVSSINAVYFNNGSGLFTLNQTLFFAAGTISASVAAGDVDGDGDLDLLFGDGDVNNGIAQVNVLWLNNGAGTFSLSSIDFPATVTKTVNFADFDRDGDLDFFTGCFNVQSLLFENR